ncbi:hypothetical protein HUG17_5505 [Dermatophagoides farinae]|uniref:Uncharacterized protein n=1 Tax=Dermatophagoides farinae TaxID=6954 RepID=A0A9D4SIH4_DERFA|nr:hypothetical protein HUG17_5505 [Dermatophagoides farinae]
MKSAAKARPDDPTKIIAEELANFFANHLPAYTNIIRTVQRASKPLKRSNLESTIRFPDLPRTNNSLECFHGAFHRFVGKNCRNV